MAAGQAVEQERGPIARSPRIGTIVVQHYGVIVADRNAMLRGAIGKLPPAQINAGKRL